jgi:hypothetical protein
MDQSKTVHQLKRLFGVEYLERAIAFSESFLVQGRTQGTGIPLLNGESQDCQ